MQIVIGISEKDYNRLKRKDDFDDMFLNYYEKAIVHGTPLPKGHGRIIDESKITQIKWETIEEEFESRLQGTIKHRYPVFKGSDAPTIIEADKAESEDKE